MHLDGSSHSSVDAIVGAVAGVLLTVVSSMGSTNKSWVLIIVADVEAQTGWVNVAVTPEEESTKYWLGKDVKNTIEGCLGVGRNDVSTLGESPRNGVEEPKEDGPNTADEISP